MFMEDGSSSILLRPDATRWDAMHECTDYFNIQREV